MSNNGNKNKTFELECALPINLLTAKGFNYNQEDNSINCTSCDFKYKNLKSPYVTQLLFNHCKHKPNCRIIEFHISFMDRIVQHQNRQKGAKICHIESEQQIMQQRQNRIESFKSSPMHNIHTEKYEKLADNGFYLIEALSPNLRLLKIACVFCSYLRLITIEYDLHIKTEDPFEQHQKASPNCPVFRVNLNDTNHQMTQLIDSIVKQPLNINETNLEIYKSVLSNILNAESDKPFHSGYITEQSRLESFKNWPANQFIVPADLAKAGFYYCGYQDQVRCFFCNGIRKDWDPTDEPIWEHARWFPKCSYIRQLMGSKFLDEVKERYQNQSSGFTDDIDNQPQYYDLANDPKYDDNKENSIKSDTLPLTQSRTNHNHQNINDRDGVCSNIAPVAQNSTRFRAPSPRSINSRLDLPSIRKAMDLGIKRNILKQVIEMKLKEEGKDYENVVELVKACKNHEENANRLQEQFKDSFHLYMANIPNDVRENDVKNLLNNSFNVKSVVSNLNGIFLVSLDSIGLQRLDDIIEKLRQSSITKLPNKIIVKALCENRKECKDFFDANFDEIIQTFKKVLTDHFKNEYEELMRDRRCVVCFKEIKNVLLLPCSHLVVCVCCRSKLQKCPLCRTEIIASQIISNYYF